ncbi:D-tyrosyl-tRNA(Tyr) deacylase [Candidatus Poribacteria bacterium]|nr:D-tyrosyl-tRNA(Tyr) deacylase [Candidatus Poribacteria bacterium]
MRAVVQRVSEASVSIDGEIVSRIGKGLLIFLGVGAGDTESDAEYLADKIANLRIFEDEKGKMNLSVLDVGGEAMVVSQFTLYGDCRKGRRPSFTQAAKPDKAQVLYSYFILRLREEGVPTREGVFQAHMKVNLTNDGPVTILLDSGKSF